MVSSPVNSSVCLSKESQSQIDTNSALLQCLQNIDRNLFDANRILVESVIPAAQRLAEKVKECDSNSEILKTLFVAADMAENYNESTDVDLSSCSEQSHVSNAAKQALKMPCLRSFE